MKFTIGQIVFFILCLFAAGFLDFYLGARFGPELFWGIRVDRANRERLLPEDTPSAELEALLAEEAQKLTFHQVLENTTPSQQGVTVEDIQERGPPPVVADSIPSEKKKEESGKEEVKKEVKREKQESPPKAESPEEKKPEPAHFTLQVGSFSDPEQALSVKKAFISRGYSAFITEVKIAGKGKWYRVHVGSYVSEEEALKSQSQINQNYKIMPLIVKL